MPRPQPPPPHRFNGKEGPRCECSGAHLRHAFSHLEYVFFVHLMRSTARNNTVQGFSGGGQKPREVRHERHWLAWHVIASHGMAWHLVLNIVSQVLMYRNIKVSIYCIERFELCIPCHPRIFHAGTERKVSTYILRSIENQNRVDSILRLWVLYRNRFVRYP